MMAIRIEYNLIIKKIQIVPEVLAGEHVRFASIYMGVTGGT